MTGDVLIRPLAILTATTNVYRSRWIGAGETDCERQFLKQIFPVDIL